MKTLGFDKVIKGLKAGKAYARADWSGASISAEQPRQVYNVSYVLPYIVHVDGIGRIMAGWAPTQADMFAEDWLEVG